jgi:hypothetical protein
MLALEAGDARDLIEAAVTAVSVLGGAMAYHSGYAASRAMAEDQPPETIGHRVNEGLAQGFAWGWPAALVALMIRLWI